MELGLRVEERYCHGRGRYPVNPPDKDSSGRPPLAVLLYIASLTEPLVNFATNVIGDLGLAGIFILMLLDSACIPTSSEAIMLFAGFEVSDGRFTMLEIVLAGVIGNVIGSWIAYGIGYYGRVELLEKHGKWLHITPKHLAWADRWFERYGNATVFFSRMLPVIRTFISLPAGVARMPFWRFTLLSTLGIIPWVLAFGLTGQAVGDRWDEWQENLHYADYVIVAGILGFVAYLLYRRRKNRTPDLQADPPVGGGTGSQADAAVSDRSA
jgi:membrane protein DedA with SNARE-associated domain